ncbi:MAG TPA: outer membrane beta-barrel protein [Burkholderiaceae bacterium]|nr:outer membrane beta-barrel protein [Burkholderiaceae bacterium]
MRINKQVAFGLALVAASAAASAQGYGVISVGTARLDADCAGTTSCDKTGTAFKLMGGYKFAPNLAWEVGYFDFGKARAADGSVAGEIKTNAFGGGVAFHQDLSSAWNFVARGGLARVKTKITGTVGSASASDSDNSVQPYLGLGIGYKLNKTMSIDGAWDFTRSKYDKNGATFKGNVNAFSLGLSFGF